MGGEYNITLAANAKTVKEFDEGLTRGTFFLLTWMPLVLVGSWACRSMCIVLDIKYMHHPKS